ncbi:hypothetical protein IHQ56_07115 [Methylobacillus flagellatus]|uniref:hypothetical protein n=1 Tax=Methylobacillus flagellatus TaxID=405 RepID=UPI00285413D0|nr:hypothetical protein [Methylobacillus flagellatus]MDR5171581.1 hypothetical protein [Methylobacillus flagellatus]
MAGADSTLSSSVHEYSSFNIKLGRALFSDPQRDRHRAIVVANHQDIVAGIEALDLVRVDFTANKIDRDGLYIITLDDNWIGYRRFQYAPELKIIDDNTSYLVTDEMMKSIKVVGRVLDIYRRA